MSCPNSPGRFPLWSPLWVTRWLLPPDVTDGAGAQVCRCPRQVFPKAANDPGLIRSDYECVSGHPHSHPLRERERDGGVLSSLPPGRQNPTNSTLRLSWERLLREGGAWVLVPSHPQCQRALSCHHHKIKGVEGSADMAGAEQQS